MNRYGEISLGGVVLLVALAMPCVRVIAFHSVPWRYAFFPVVIWAVSIVGRAVQGFCAHHAAGNCQSDCAKIPEEETGGNI